MRIRVAPSSFGQTLFALIFAGFGVFFTFLLGRAMMPAYASWFWPATECTVEASRFVDTGNPQPNDGDWQDAGAATTAQSSSRFRFEVRYGYDWQGRHHTGRVYKLGYDGGDDPAVPQKLVLDYPAGAMVRCYVDPKDPSRAALRRANLWTLLILGFPLLFVAVGVGVVVAAWWRPRAAPTAVAAVKPLGQGEMSPAKMIGCIVAFFGVFAVFGLAFLIPFFGVPAWHALQARSWSEVPCTIQSSAVGAHSSSDGGPTYSVDVVYTYEIGGRAYTGNRYEFVGGSSSGEEGKQAVVATLPAGTVTRCYVDPADPTSAVLRRGLTATLWFALIPGVFVLIGVGGAVVGAIAVLRQGKKRGVEQWLPGLQGTATARGNAVLDMPLGMSVASSTLSTARVLKPSQGPIFKLGCSFFLAVFVNGLVGVFVWKAVVEPMSTGGKPEGCVAPFLIPFALIALGLLVNVPYQMLAFFNPRPHLELDPGVLQPGTRARLRWRFSGLARRLDRVQITIEGTEEASHRVGTTTNTATSVFWRQAVLDAAQKEQIANGGEVAIEVPANLVPSFNSTHNKIVYKMKLQGSIARWPDVADEFEIVVAPEGSPQ